MKAKHIFIAFGLIFSLLASVIIANRTFNFYIFNPESDYFRYIERAQSNSISDSPLSYLLMKIYTMIFGVKNGVSVLGFTFGFTVLIFFMYKFYLEERRFLFALFPLLLIGNLAFRQHLSGLLRSLIGFSMVIIASLYEIGDLKVNVFTILVTALVYYPSAIYYTLYKTLKRENLREIYLTLIGITLVGLQLSVENKVWKENILKTLQLITPPSITREFYNQDTIFALPQFYGWFNYMIIIYAIFTSIIVIDYLKTRNRETLFWGALFFLPLIPYRGIWLSKRLMWINWVPMNMILYYTEENIHKIAQIGILSFYFIKILTYQNNMELIPLTNILRGILP